MKLITFAFVLQFIITCWPKTDIVLMSYSAQGRRSSYFQAQALYLSLRTSYAVNIKAVMFFMKS